jgi:hypothetical protein
MFAASCRRREMELLQQEKMAHVEELRQIHADINAVSGLHLIKLRLGRCLADLGSL